MKKISKMLQELDSDVDIIPIVLPDYKFCPTTLYDVGITFSCISLFLRTVETSCFLKTWTRLLCHKVSYSHGTKWIVCIKFILIKLSIANMTINNYEIKVTVFFFMHNNLNISHCMASALFFVRSYVGLYYVMFDDFSAFSVSRPISRPIVLSCLCMNILELKCT